MVQSFSRLGTHIKHRTAGYKKSLLTLGNRRVNLLLGIWLKCSRHILGMAVSLALYLERKEKTKKKYKKKIKTQVLFMLLNFGQMKWNIYSQSDCIKKLQFLPILICIIDTAAGLNNLICPHSSLRSKKTRARSASRLFSFSQSDEETDNQVCLWVHPVEPKVDLFLHWPLHLPRSAVPSAFLDESEASS